MATNQMHMAFVFLAKGEGVRREHVAMSFQAMVAEWGLPKMRLFCRAIGAKNRPPLFGLRFVSTMSRVFGPRHG